MLATSTITREGLLYTGRGWAKKIVRDFGVDCEGRIWHKWDGAGGKVI